MRCFISSERDVLALEIDDTRAAPPPLKVTVTAVRPLEVRTGEHLARVEFPAAGKDIVLLQRFDEKDYHCSGAVAARIMDREASLAPAEGPARSMTAPGKTGQRLVLISTAGSWKSGDEAADQATRLLADTGDAVLRRFASRACRLVAQLLGTHLRAPDQRRRLGGLPGAHPPSAPVPHGLHLARAGDHGHEHRDLVPQR